MSVVIETTVGDITVDLFLQDRPKACINFLKLCKLKYYNYNLFHTIEHGFIAQTGDPTGSGNGGQSVWGVIEGPQKRYFEAEYMPKKRHNEPGLLSMVSTGNNMVGSQFFFTLGADLKSLDGIHCIIGEVTEGLESLRKLNEAICDDLHRPYQDIRVTHTVILEDPFDDPRGFRQLSRSPSPTVERLRGGRIGADEEIDDTDGKSAQEIQEMLQDREAKARATILEIVGDLPDANIAPPENVLFVCKLNPVTTDDDLEIIFSRFGKIKSCEVIRDRVSADSLQYAFVEFENKKSCEDAYFKMDNVLIDDRRIHVDFSQSVSKIKWRGKGRGVIHFDKNNKDGRLDFSDLKGTSNRGKYDRFNQNSHSQKRNHQMQKRDRSRSHSPWKQNRQNNDRRECSKNRINQSQQYSQRRWRDNQPRNQSTSSRYEYPSASNYRQQNDNVISRNNYRKHNKRPSRSPSKIISKRRSRSINRESSTRYKKSRSHSPDSSSKNKRSIRRRNKSSSKESTPEKRNKKSKHQKSKKNKKSKNYSSSSDSISNSSSNQSENYKRSKHESSSKKYK